MHVAAGDGRVVDVVVMAVVVRVVVDVLERLVGVLVRVLAAEHERHAPGRHERGHHGDRPDRLAEGGPGHEHADERRGREHELSACRPELAGTRHPQRDRRAVPQRTDRERGQCRPHRWGAGDHEADDQVRRPGHDALGEGDVARREPVDRGGDAVVHGPAQARRGDEHGTPAHVGSAAPPHHHRRSEDQHRAADHAAAEVLVEEHRGHERGEHEFEVEQQRGRGGVHRTEAGGQEHRSHGAAQDHRRGERRRIGAQGGCGGPVPHHHGSHRDRRSHVEQAGEHDGVQITRETGGRRRRRAEQHRCGAAPQDPEPNVVHAATVSYFA